MILEGLMKYSGKYLWSLGADRQEEERQEAEIITD